MDYAESDYHTWFAECTISLPTSVSAKVNYPTSNSDTLNHDVPGSKR